MLTPSRPDGLIQRITEPGKPTEHHVFAYPKTLDEYLRKRAREYYTLARNEAIEAGLIERVQHCHQRLALVQDLSIHEADGHKQLRAWLAEEGFVMPPPDKAYIH